MKRIKSATKKKKKTPKKQKENNIKIYESDKIQF